MHDISAYFRTRRLLGWFIGLVILALLAAMVYLAALPFLAYFPFTDLPNLLDKPESYQDYGAWLAGALTPLLAITALVSWWFQKSGQDKANQIQGQTLVLTNVHELYGGLNYMAWCAIGARHPEPGKVVQQGNLQEVERLTWLLRNRGSEKVVVGTEVTAVPYNEIVSSPFFERLFNNLNRTIELIETADLKFLIDERIFTLHDEMRSARVGK